jgi:hypothetical protein
VGTFRQPYRAALFVPGTDGRESDAPVEADRTRELPDATRDLRAG